MAPSFSSTPPNNSTRLEVNYVSKTSTFSNIIQTLLRPLKPRMAKPKPPPDDVFLPSGSPKLTPPRLLLRLLKTEVAEREVCGVYTYTLTPHDARKGTEKRKKKRKVYYFHGGSFLSPPTNAHWWLCSRLTAFANEVVLVSYPLSPHAYADKCLDVIERLFAEVLFVQGGREEEEVMLAGDSSGATVLCSAALAVLSRRPPQTNEKQLQKLALTQLLLISAPCDFRHQNPEMLELEKKDAIMSLEFVKFVAHSWLGESGAAEDDPRVSLVLRTDFRVFREQGIVVHGVVGENDVLAADQKVLMERLWSEGVAGRWLLQKSGMHCFLLAGFYGMPEGRWGLTWVGEVLEKEGRMN